MDAATRWAALVDAFLGEPDVTPPTGGSGFGAGALKVKGRIFAMLAGEALVVKLPRARVDALMAAGDGHRFDPGHGRVMREWLALDGPPGDRWPALAREALMYVRGSGAAR